MSFDISQKEQALAIEDDGLVVHIMDEDGEPAFDDAGQPVTWTVFGMNAKRYRAAEAWQRKKYQSFGGRKLTGEETLRIQSEFIARVSAGFSGFTDKGHPVAFSTETATETLTRLPFIQKQLEQAIGDRARFLARTSTSSVSPSATTHS